MRGRLSHLFSVFICSLATPSPSQVGASQVSNYSHGQSKHGAGKGESWHLKLSPLSESFARSQMSLSAGPCPPPPPLPPQSPWEYVILFPFCPWLCGPLSLSLSPVCVVWLSWISYSIRYTSECSVRSDRMTLNLRSGGGCLLIVFICLLPILFARGLCRYCIHS